MSTATEKCWPVKTLRFYLDEGWNKASAPLGTFLDTPAPYLDTLELEMDSGGLDTLFGGVAPNLTRVILTEAELRSTTQPFSSLRYLEMADISGLTVPGLVNLIRHSLRLEELSIIRTQFNTGPDDDAAEGNGPSPLLFPSLKALTLQGVAGVACLEILQILAVPHAARLFVVPYPQIGTSGLFQWALAELYTSGGLAVFVPDTWSGQLTPNVIGDNWRINTVCEPPMWESQHAEWYSEMFTRHAAVPPTLCAITVHVGFDCSRDTSPYILPAAHAAFPNVHTLTLNWKERLDDGTLIQTLQRPSSLIRTNGEGAIWILPRVSIVIVTVNLKYPPERAVNDLLRLARARRQVGPSDDYETPIPIHTVRIIFNGEKEVTPDVYAAIDEVRKIVQFVKVG